MKIYLFSLVLQLLRVRWYPQVKVWKIFFTLLLMFIVLGLFFFGIEAASIELFKVLKII